MTHGDARFPLETILAIFNLLVLPVPKTKFQVSQFHSLEGVVENVKR